MSDLSSWLKGFVADNMAGVSPDDIPVFLFQLFCAGLFSLIFLKTDAKIRGNSGKVMPYLILAITTALVTSLVKFSGPLALLVVALAILVRNTKATEPFNDLLRTYVVLGLSIGCGAGQPILTGVGFAVLMLVFVVGPWNKNKSV